MLPIQCSTYYAVYTQLLQYVIVCVRVPKTYIVPLLSTLIRSDTSLGDWTTWRADGYSAQMHNNYEIYNVIILPFIDKQLKIGVLL